MKRLEEVLPGLLRIPSVSGGWRGRASLDSQESKQREKQGQIDAHYHALEEAVAYVEALLPDSLPRHRGSHQGFPYLEVSPRLEERCPAVLILIHLDVVPGAPEQFEPRIEGERLIGRGAMDMKGPGLATLYALCDLWEEGLQPDVAILLSTDEERGGHNGVEYLVRERGWRGRFAFVPDGGPNFVLSHQGKGILHLTWRSRGVASHGSTPWLGSNALERLLEAYFELKRALKVPPCYPPDYWGETINLGVMHGGSKVNIVPEEAEARLDLRFTSPWTVAQLEQVIAQFSQRLGLDYTIEARGEPFATPRDHPLLQQLKTIMEQELSRGVMYGRGHGATDGRFLAQQGIPLALTFPLGGGIHAEEEWVLLPSLEQLRRIVRTFLRQVALPSLG